MIMVTNTTKMNDMVSLVSLIKMKITSEPVYETKPDGKLRIGIPNDWKVFYECGCPNSPDRFGDWNPSMGICHAVFRYERQIRDHLFTRHRVYASRRHLNRKTVEVKR